LRAGAGESPQTVTQGAFNEDGMFFCVESESRKVWKYDGEWTELAATAGLENERLAALAVNPRDQKIYVFTHLGKAFAFDRNGNFLRQLPTRAKVGNGDPPWLKISNRSFAIANVDFDPVIADRIWVAAGTGVYYADIKDGNDGITWISQTRGIEELVTNDIYQAPDRPPLFAAWDFGIHRKENLDVFSESYGPKERVLIAAQQIAGTVSNPDFVVTNASDTLRCCWQDGDAILAGYSTDAGKTWRKFPTLPKPPILDADTGRLGGPWLMSYGMIAVASDDQRNIVWVPSGNKAPYVTRDLGQSWQRVEFPGEILPYTGSHRDYYLGRRVLAADTVEPGTFYLVHSGNPSNPQLEGVWRSTDQGRTWARVYRGEVAPSSGYSAKLRAVPGRAGHVFFTSGLLSPQANRSGLRRSLDGGKTWNAVQDVSDVDDIGFGKALRQEDYPAIYISGRVRGENGIWRSTDNTGSWHRIATFPIGSLDQVANIAGDPSHFGRVYIGFKGSGWVYGEPTKCVPKSYEPSDFSECFEIR
jgi:photosystem II stability/assembly factor-like uncharacterized protein